MSPTGKSSCLKPGAGSKLLGRDGGFAQVPECGVRYAARPRLYQGPNFHTENEVVPAARRAGLQASGQHLHRCFHSRGSWRPRWPPRNYPLVRGSGASTATPGREGSARPDLHERRRSVDLGWHDRVHRLALAMVEEDHGEEVAKAVAKKLVVYHRRTSGQSQFSALLELQPSQTAYRRRFLSRGPTFTKIFRWKSLLTSRT